MTHGLSRRIDFAWRFFATGTSFAVFGIAGALFSVLVFPLACVWPYRASRQRVVTRVIHLFFRTLVSVLQRIGVMELDVAGVEALRARGPMIVVANHPTYLDVVVLLALLPRACCVVKNAHWRNPCLWGIVRAAEYISNAEPSELIKAGTRQIAAGYTIIMFPEGSRSPAPNRMHAFSRGFAHMALATGAPILPVLIDCDPPAFTKQMRWYDVPARSFRLRLTVLDALATAYPARPQPPAIAARTLTCAIEAHINQRLLDHGFFKT